MPTARRLLNSGPWRIHIHLRAVWCRLHNSNLKVRTKGHRHCDLLVLARQLRRVRVRERPLSSGPVIWSSLHRGLRVARMPLMGVLERDPRALQMITLLSSEHVAGCSPSWEKLAARTSAAWPRTGQAASTSTFRSACVSQLQPSSPSWPRNTRRSENLRLSSAAFSPNSRPPMHAILRFPFYFSATTAARMYSMCVRCIRDLSPNTLETTSKSWSKCCVVFF